MRRFKVAVLVGSLRKGSYSRALARAMIGLAPETLACEMVAIGELPLYDSDLEEPPGPPPAWSGFRTAIGAADAVMFVTPEYNRSVPGALKNALDVGSRPPGRSVWNGKPAAVVSNSPGAMGGFGANHHLRQSLVFLNMPVLQQPEAYIGHADSLLTQAGEFASAGARDYLDGLMKAFAGWIARTASPAAAD